ncbi:MAG: hypothetical protein HY815_01590 [Candidatus Riflebacteria bacterium]|nr:hypothetical protein [Candidatus Riflebacteria bacterium]
MIGPSRPCLLVACVVVSLVAGAAGAQQTEVNRRDLTALGVDPRQLSVPPVSLPELRGSLDGMKKYLGACGMDLTRVEQVLGSISVKFGSPARGNAEYSILWNTVTLGNDTFKTPDGQYQEIRFLDGSAFGTFLHELYHGEYDVFIEENNDSEDRSFNSELAAITERIRAHLPTNACVTSGRDNQHMQEMTATYLGNYVGEVVSVATMIYKTVIWPRDALSGPIPKEGEFSFELGTMKWGSRKLSEMTAFAASGKAYHQHGRLFKPLYTPSAGESFEGCCIHHISTLDLTDAEKALVRKKALRLSGPETPAELVAAMNRAPLFDPARKAAAASYSLHRKQIMAEVGRALTAYVTGGQELDPDNGTARPRFIAVRTLIRNAGLTERFKAEVVTGLLLGTGDTLKEKLGRFLVEADETAPVAAAGATAPSGQTPISILGIEGPGLGSPAGR